MSRIRITDPAIADLDQIWEYIAKDNVAAADHWLRRLASKLDLYASEPLLGEGRPELGRDLRQIIFGNYVVFYRRTDEGIEVLRVLHSARNIRRRDLR